MSQLTGLLLITGLISVNQVAAQKSGELRSLNGSIIDSAIAPVTLKIVPGLPPKTGHYGPNK